MRRLRVASKAPIAVAGILSLPLFFVGLMAFSLKLDKPSRHTNAKGAIVLGDPTKGTVGTIYLCAFALVAGLVLVGVLASLLRSRLGGLIPAAAGTVAAVLLLVPLGSWAAEHTARYPLGIDNIPPKSPQDLFLRGEWEQSAQSTAHQIGLVTIGMGIAAIVLTVLIDLRRRRGRPDLYEPSSIDVDLYTGGLPPQTGI